jgi:hypothetical protein
VRWQRSSPRTYRHWNPRTCDGRARSRCDLRNCRLALLASGARALHLMPKGGSRPAHASFSPPITSSTMFPAEVFHRFLSHPPADEPSSVSTLLALHLVSKTVFFWSRQNIVWCPLVECRWTHGLAHHVQLPNTEDQALIDRAIPPNQPLPSEACDIFRTRTIVDRITKGLDHVHSIGKYFRSVGEDREFVQSQWSEMEYPRKGAPA